MSMGTYGELQDTLRKWLGRIESDVDLVPMIPDFIELAESGMRSDLDARVMEIYTVPTDLVSPDPLPADYGQVKSMLLINPDDGTVKRELHFATTKEIARNIERWGDGGDPQVYTIDGGFLSFWPQGKDADPKWQYQMIYKAVPKLGPDPATTNKVLQDWPGVYLYGSLVHTAPYLEEDGRVATWMGMYDKEITRVQRDADLSEAGTAVVSMPGNY